jgi:hypothetical protein
VYEPHIFDVKAEFILRVEAANANHARQKLSQLFAHRVTQYAHPDDIQPTRMIAVVIDGKLYEPIRVELNDERDTQRPPFDAKETSKKNPL